MKTGRRKALALGAASPLLLAQGSPVARPPRPLEPGLPYRHYAVRSPDGVMLSVYDYGNEAAQPILCLHGYMQAALCWDRQCGDAALAQEFRLVGLDLRGHGMSDKPVGDDFYKPSRPWADDIKAVIDTLGLVRPVLVGWSYAGRVMGDYLTVHGHGAIGAMNWVAAISISDPAGFGRGNRFGPQIVSPDPATAIRGTTSFLRECFEVQPTTGEFETTLAYNMMVPRHVRISLTGRPADYAPQLRALDIPVLVTHGRRDKIVNLAMSEYTARMAPGARLSIYEESGHSPFWEDAPRFNRELAELARAVRRG